MRIRLVIGSVFLLLTLAVAPAVAFGYSVDYRVAAVDYQAGTIALSAQGDAPQATFVLTAKGIEVGRHAPAEGATGVLFDPYRLAVPTVFHLDVYDAAAVLVWSSEITVDPATLVPSTPVMSVASGSIVPASWSAKGISDRATGVRFSDVDAGSVRNASVESSGTGLFALATRKMPLGETYYKVVATNAFGSSTATKLRVYRLPSGMPKKKSYVFASKKILWMFHVKSGRVVHRWPIAIGTQRTPTPTGTFKIGRARKSGGVWGPMRRRLWRIRKGRSSVATAYWIHGNNASWTIGTPASHGCIRMYNKDIREFKRVVPTGTWVVIK